MRQLHEEQDTEEWQQKKKGRIGGSGLKSTYATGKQKKDGFYQLLADRLALVDESGDGSDRDRGHDKEVEALEMFEQETGKKVWKKPGLWVSDDNDNIALSPDGLVVEEGESIYREACEVKALAAKNHLRAVIEEKIPKDFWLQVIQYFIVNEHLETLHFIFYDDRVTFMPFYMIDVTRDEVAEEVEFYRQYENNVLKEIDELIEKFAF